MKKNFRFALVVLMVLVCLPILEAFATSLLGEAEKISVFTATFEKAGCIVTVDVFSGECEAVSDLGILGENVVVSIGVHYDAESDSAELGLIINYYASGIYRKTPDYQHFGDAILLANGKRLKLSNPTWTSSTQKMFTYPLLVAKQRADVTDTFYKSAKGVFQVTTVGERSRGSSYQAPEQELVYQLDPIDLDVKSFLEGVLTEPTIVKVQLYTSSGTTYSGEISVHQSIEIPFDSTPAEHLALVYQTYKAL